MPKGRSYTFLFVASFSSVVVVLCEIRRRRRAKDKGVLLSHGIAHHSAYEALIGKTPMVRLHKLSAILERSIYVKMESLNPGGTGKDRAALGMLRAAEEAGDLPDKSCVAPTFSATTDINQSVNTMNESIIQAMKHSRTGGLVVEGTSGSTGIALATLCRSRGHALIVVLPDDQAVEKQNILHCLHATVHVVPTASISNPKHYVNIARKLAEHAKNRFGIQAVFINQFENLANVQTHYQETGPELYQQCPDMSAFVMSSGTGGTIAGVGLFLKETRSTIKVVLVDPPGSSLYNKIHHGVAYTPQQRERTLKRHRYDTIAEGIGLDRITNNMREGLECIDDAVQVSDQEALDMAHWLLEEEGLWVGSSSAMNVVGAVRTAKEMPQGAKVVTIICDGGQRHLTRFWDRDFCQSWGLTWPEDTAGQGTVPECLQ